MIEDFEEISIVTVEDEYVEDYSERIYKVKRKLFRKSIIIGICSVFILITSLSDKHDDFDVILNSNIFVILFLVAVLTTIVAMIYVYRSRDLDIDTKIFKNHKRLLDALDILSIIPIFVVVLTLSNVFVISPSFIDGSSMEPNYYDGDDILFWHLNVEYERYDVVILEANDNNYWIKRIIGLPGDTVVLENGVVSVNGIEIDQEFLRDDNGSIDDYTVCRIGDADYCEFNVPIDEYFVLGDNRSVSDDSRSSNLGFVTEEQLFGKVIFKFNNLLRN